MTKDRDLKRLIRARMKKTGESYTAARAVLLARRHPPEADFAELAGTRDESVQAKTGRTWREWVDALDAIDAVALPHAEIARRLGAEFGLGSWWAQMVTVGYERIRGLRDIGQRRGGGYDVNKSKTLPVPVREVYAAFADEGLRRRWLTDADPEIRTARPHTSIRMVWDDDRRVNAHFREKGEAKSTVAIQHLGLPDREAADAARARWTERIEKLARLLTAD